MENEKANTNREKFLNSVNSAVEEIGYVEGGDTTPLLRKTLLNYLTLDSLGKLWGPGWSLFVTYTVHAMYTECGMKVSYDAMKTIISEMSGHDEALPTDLIGESESDPESLTDERAEHAFFLATLICWELKVPSPVEVEYLIAVLGENATPVGAEALWVTNPEKYKLDITSERAMVSMAKAADRINSERAGAVFDEDRGKEYYEMLARVAKKCKAHFATIAQAGRPGPEGEAEKHPGREGEGTAESSRNSEEPTADIETLILNIGSPSGMTAGGSHHSGGSSSKWTTGEIVLGVAAVAAAGAALWYGYNKLVADDFDVELSEFSIPDLDFDFEIPEIDFDF